MAPCDGWCTSLDEVPDEVFAGRMLGDGLAIDPTTGIIFAPCDGEVLTLPDSGHAVTIRGAPGFDVLIHIGIDTVQLAGKGFEARVKPGSRVRIGDELIRFDLDLVARAAKSLMIPIVMISDGIVLEHRRSPGLIAAGELLFEVLFEVQNGAAGPASSDPTPAIERDAARIERRANITLKQGLHARPAALLARRAKALDMPVMLIAHGRESDARSVVGIMALGVRCGDELLIRAQGAGAAEAVAALMEGLEEALRMERAHGAAAESPVPPVPPVSPVPLEPAQPAMRTSAPQLRPGLMSGVCAASGFAVGRATRIERREIEVEEHGLGELHETGELARARSNVKRRLERVRDTGGAERREIIDAHLEFLDDPTLNGDADALIGAGKSAGSAWRGATRRAIDALQALDDARLRERADDLKDVEGHVLLALTGEARPMHLPLPARAVLLADDLLPSELTALDRQRLAAIVLGGGGATSHVAILAAAMGLPMLVGVGTALATVSDGQQLIVDADHGVLDPAPSVDALIQAEARVEVLRAQALGQRLAAAQECHSLDGTRVEVFANLGSVADAIAAVDQGAEGCGLLRTEFLFIDRDTAPTESEQLAAYQSIANALAGRPLILRMMDVGGDKPLKYMPLPHEPNPALGLRGVRTAMAYPQLMRTQLRAALRVQPYGIVRLLIPMVTDRSEILAVRALVALLMREIRPQQPLQIGAMIETPAAALTAASLMHEVDFVSIGSNDLTQYTLAMDRGHAQLARRTDALHPAVLQLIGAAAMAGEAAGKLVAVCGGVAADRSAVPILLGLGVRELSVVPAAIPALKRQIGALRIEECRALAARCLSLGSAADVRSLVEQTYAHGEEST
jgi:phosphoenolpyruvate-protein phosphotransferase